jgi:hypothetical protein
MATIQPQKVCELTTYAEKRREAAAHTRGRLHTPSSAIAQHMLLSFESGARAIFCLRHGHVNNGLAPSSLFASFRSFRQFFFQHRERFLGVFDTQNLNELESLKKF